MTPTKAFLSLLISAGLVAAATPALAQQRAFDPNAPLDIFTEEQLAFDAQTCTAKLTGNFQITQDQMRLLGESLTARSPKRSGACRDSDINRVEVDRNVFYVTPTERVRADHAVYDLQTDTVTFTGGVIVVRGENVSSSQRLVINLRTNDFTLSGGVRAILYPDRRTP